MKRADLVRPRTRPVVSTSPPSLLPEQPTSEMVGSHNVNSVIIIAIINVKEDFVGLSVTDRIWRIVHFTHPL